MRGLPHRDQLAVPEDHGGEKVQIGQPELAICLPLLVADLELDRGSGRLGERHRPCWRVGTAASSDALLVFVKWLFQIVVIASLASPAPMAPPGVRVSRRTGCTLYFRTIARSASAFTVFGARFLPKTRSQPSAYAAELGRLRIVTTRRGRARNDRYEA